jgi:hypothetical protein
MGGAEGTGVLRCAWDDGRNRQRQGQEQEQEQLQGQKQIPFGDDNQRNNGKSKNNGKNKQKGRAERDPFVCCLLRITGRIGGAG